MSPPDPLPVPGAEFDAYAQDYAGGMDNPIKSLLGDSADSFIAVKLRWLLRRFPDLGDQDRTFRLLDYGCGTATLLRLMAAKGLKATLIGCDVAPGMLEAAARTWPASIPLPDLHRQHGTHVPLPSESIDLIIVSSVLHHVPRQDRPVVYRELHRLLRPAGRLVVFEHNPLNPVTRYVVAHTPIDQNAILLRSREVHAGLIAERFSDVSTSYLMFLPPRLHHLAALEAAIAWLPLGGQYATTARRTEREPD